MFDNVINLNKYIKPKVIEEFLVSGGNKTSISDSTKVTKNFENNQKINRSMMVESITKLVNNVSSDVIQKNSSTAASAAGASNTLWLSGVNCDDVVVSGVRQGAEAQNTTLVKSSQSNMSKISNEISTSIDKTIEKVGGTDLAALQAENTKQLNDFMKATPGYDPNKAQKLASKCPSGGGSLISAGNKCNVDSSYELDASVKQALELDESFKINDKDDISNDIKNKLEQANFASCQANASASNAIMLNDITCASMSAASKAQKSQEASDKGETLSASRRGRLEISDIEQQAVAKLYMTCIFDQKNVSEIANKITNSISKKYNQIYDAVNKKAEGKDKAWLDEKMKLVDALSAAGVEKIMAAAGDLPPATSGGGSAKKTPDSGTTSKTDEVKSDGSKSGGPTTDALPTLGPKSSDSSGIKFNTPASKPADSLAKPTTPPAQTTGAKSEVSNTSASKESQQPQPQSQTQSPSTKSKEQPVPSQIEALIANPYILYGGIALIIIIVFGLVVMMTSKGSSDSDE
jgi:hypothetical protein